MKTEKSLKPKTKQIEIRIELCLTLFHLSFFFLVSFCCTPLGLSFSSETNPFACYLLPVCVAQGMTQAAYKLVNKFKPPAVRSAGESKRCALSLISMPSADAPFAYRNTGGSTSQRSPLRNKPAFHGEITEPERGESVFERIVQYSCQVAPYTHVLYLQL